MLGLDVPTLISRIITLVIAFSVHEFAHAWTANRYGDDTPRMHGRLTLNPLAHLDVMGSLMLIVAGFGWAKPVPVNPYALERRSPAALLVVSLAGPLSNFMLAILAAIPLRLQLLPNVSSGTLLPSPMSFVFDFMLINLALMLFNLIPIAPLDGDKIADFFIPAKWDKVWQQFRTYGPMFLLVLLFVLPLIKIDVINWIISPVLSNLISF